VHSAQTVSRPRGKLAARAKVPGARRHLEGTFGPDNVKLDGHKLTGRCANIGRSDGTAVGEGGDL